MARGRWIWSAAGVALLGLGGYRVAGALERNAEAAAGRTEMRPRVRAARALRSDLSERLLITGTVRPWAEAEVVPKAPGRIERLLVELGEKVDAGQPIAVLEHREAAWQAKAARAAMT